MLRTVYQDQYCFLNVEFTSWIVLKFKLEPQRTWTNYPIKKGLTYANVNIILFNHVGWFHDLEIYQLYFMGPSNTIRIFIYYSYIQANTWRFGWSYIPGNYSQESLFIPTLCTWNVVHLNTFHMKHCSSQYYALKILLIATLSLQILTLFMHYSLFVLASISFWLLLGLLPK